MIVKVFSVKFLCLLGISISKFCGLFYQANILLDFFNTKIMFYLVSLSLYKFTFSLLGLFVYSLKSKY